MRQLQDEGIARLVAMRRHGISHTGGTDRPPMASAKWPHHGGPGVCCSCGDALCHTHALGRCDDCQAAAEAFYRELSMP